MPVTILVLIISLLPSEETSTVSPSEILIFSPSWIISMELVRILALAVGVLKTLSPVVPPHTVIGTNLRAFELLHAPCKIWWKRLPALAFNKGKESKQGQGKSIVVKIESYLLSFLLILVVYKITSRDIAAQHFQFQLAWQHCVFPNCFNFIESLHNNIRFIPSLPLTELQKGFGTYHVIEHPR